MAGQILMNCVLWIQEGFSFCSLLRYFGKKPALRARSGRLRRPPVGDRGLHGGEERDGGDAGRGHGLPRGPQDPVRGEAYLGRRFRSQRFQLTQGIRFLLSFDKLCNVFGCVLGLSYFGAVRLFLGFDRQ